MGSNVVPDVVWISHERLAALMDEAGHLTGAPELAVEVLLPGVENERRDREAKLKLYESRDTRILDRRLAFTATRGLPARPGDAATGLYVVYRGRTDLPFVAWIFLS